MSLEMVAIRPLHRGWKDALIALVGGALEEVLVVAPFIMADGARVIDTHLSAELRNRGRLEIVTDLSPAHVCDGLLDPDALVGLVSSNRSCSIWHVPALHAKVYIADRKKAIVTSGNLTAGAFCRNVEYGIEIADAELVDRIRSDIADFQSIGARVPADSMRHYAETSRHVRETFVRQRSTVDPALTRAFSDAVQSAEEELVRLRLAGGPMHTVFARTIRILLARHGPLPTTTIHAMIQQLHPDLCDDTIDRVIDGKSFGKKWKHAVRTAQQNLKKRGAVEYKEGVWSLRFAAGEPE